jgi:hypothetical protein
MPAKASASLGSLASMRRIDRQRLINPLGISTIATRIKNI